jgi:hypothetical protein
LITDYDAIALAPTSDSPVDFDQTRFPVSDESVLVAAKELADNLRKVSMHIFM